MSGYAGVSTTEQNIELQIDALEEASNNKMCADRGTARQFRLGRSADPLGSIQQMYRRLQCLAPAIKGLERWLESKPPMKTDFLAEFKKEQLREAA